MAVSTRTGAATFFKIMVKACRLSHNKGFRAGVVALVGSDDAPAILAAWDTVCVLIELYVASDDHPFEVDATTGEEIDQPPL
jgi:hypothetical protein